ncbi:unnamed protein product [Schistocephalus solidus]|uniref:Uncharacterized protein n=1 Tax=Schistocephalus solidus TaxID=70667 RepID=A0A183TM55_SCHSO|nr:unnamed protein product [Schistocephalus solidus]
MSTPLRPDIPTSTVCNADDSVFPKATKKPKNDDDDDDDDGDDDDDDDDDTEEMEYEEGDRESGGPDGSNLGDNIREFLSFCESFCYLPSLPGFYIKPLRFLII